MLAQQTGSSHMNPKKTARIMMHALILEQPRQTLLAGATELYSLLAFMHLTQCIQTIRLNVKLSTRSPTLDQWHGADLRPVGVVLPAPASKAVVRSGQYRTSGGLQDVTQGRRRWHLQNSNGITLACQSLLTVAPLFVPKRAMKT